MTAASPVRPVIVAGPAAVRIQSVGTAVPPEVLTTFLTSVSFGAMAVLVIVQVASWPSVRETEVAVVDAAPVQTQPDAVYPVGPVSASV